MMNDPIYVITDVDGTVYGAFENYDTAYASMMALGFQQLRRHKENSPTEDYIEYSAIDSSDTQSFAEAYEDHELFSYFYIDEVKMFGDPITFIKETQDENYIVE